MSKKGLPLATIEVLEEFKALCAHNDRIAAANANIEAEEADARVNGSETDRGRGYIDLNA